MADRYEVAVKVISQKGTCGHNHKVGDEWIFRGTTPEGLCLGAYNSLHADVHALMFGGSFPWLKDPDKGIVTCPDAKNPVVFELKRLKNV